jgi:hypothetical protein
MLGGTGAWDVLQESATQLKADGAALSADIQGLAGPLADVAAELSKAALTLAEDLDAVYAAVGHGDLDLVRERLRAGFVSDLRSTSVLPRQLRALRHKAALTATNTLVSIRDVRPLVDDLNSSLTTRMVAVLADAGCGKTEMAAQLTSAMETRPAGILLHGRNLHSNHNLDNLAGAVIIGAASVKTMEALLEAVDAAGQRSRRRIPIVIDGLNEGEDPRVWKALLASMDVMLPSYPYAFVVCTLRTAFVNECIPDGVAKLEIPDFARDTVGAIEKYFRYYKIDAADAELPFELLKHPLTLRLFCEVTNPKRDRTVGVEAMPASLTGLFDRYIEQASARIAELAPLRRRYYEQDVRVALDKIGWALWKGGKRSLVVADLRRLLDPGGSSWNESLVYALEQEGILIRVRADHSVDNLVAVVYDAMAGHLIADSILTRCGRDGIEAWLQNPTNLVALTGQRSNQHPLATDIFSALAAILPRRHRQQLWPLLSGAKKINALRSAADLEGPYLDAATVGELAAITPQEPMGTRDILDRLWVTRGSPSHPLNVTFLDGVLRQMTVAQRDLRWTEWLRGRADEIVNDLERLERSWRSRAQRSASDRLRARWVGWTLTSTSRKIRDHATRALYWFGRRDPEGLFNLTLDGLAINDPQVPERLLAASYGVVMAHQFADIEFAELLGNFLSGLRDALTGVQAAHPTDHWLIRLYVQGCTTFALQYHPAAVPKGLQTRGKVRFAHGATIERIKQGDPRAAELEQALVGHYDDDTLSEFVGIRQRLGWSRPGENDAVPHLRGTLWALGWREKTLGAIDKRLPVASSRRDLELPKRYENKYAWIGLYTYPKMLDHYARLWHGARPPDIQIDPSFPDPSPIAPINLQPWASADPAKDESWLRGGSFAVPDELFRLSDVGTDSGPWLAAYGYLHSRARVPERGVFGFLTMLLVEAADYGRLVHALETKVYPGNFWLPRAPETNYTFGGEIPWSQDFAGEINEDQSQRRYRSEVEVHVGSPIEVEILAHKFGWESYHSTLNQASGEIVPSSRFSRQCDLRGNPQSFDKFMPDGSRGSISFIAPIGFDGHLLYLRQDLVEQYAAGRRIVWMIWGERELYDTQYPPPEWSVKAHREWANIWRRVVQDEAFALRPKAKRTHLSRKSRKSAGK